MKKEFLNAIVPLLLGNLFLGISGLSIASPNDIHAIHDSLTSVTPFLHHSTTIASYQSHSANLLDLYKDSLATYPLQTKMITGGTLAVTGDAIAQSRDKDEDYSKRRALSFMAFDMCYRALQHFSFPVIVQQCQGQYIGAAIASVPFLSSGLDSSLTNPTYFYGAMEQTLASQLGIVPFMYYPVFYILTAFVQGLSAEGAIQRAKETFIPLMKRNLLFWIPVQFIQFGFIEESLQIPFLAVGGLAWTFIISLFAGNAQKSYSSSSKLEEEVEMELKEIFDEVIDIEEAIIEEIKYDVSEMEKAIVDYVTEEIGIEDMESKKAKEKEKVII
mmetsp:Transcript_10470/g.13266  ORF Transcript_10470/g.13266 Transcript_10470/m.13266 type:complete len:330 (+) Transcript_10470:197-1186(+)